MTSADFSPAPFAVPSAATPNDAAPSVTLPDLEYTLYQPQQLKSRIPALMIHGFATRGEQLYGGTSWIRQYLRAGYPVLIVALPYHSDEYLKDPESMHAIDCKLPDNTGVRSGTIPFDSVPSVDAAPSVDVIALCRCGSSAADPHAPVHHHARPAAAHRRHRERPRR